MSSDLNEPIEYGDYSRDRIGWFFGLTGPQLLLVVTAGLPALLALNQQAWLVFVLWLPVWALLALLIALPVKGRPAARWLADLLLFAVGGVMGWTRWQSRAAAGTATDLDEADLPGVLSGVRIHDGPPSGASLTRPAIVQNRAELTWAAVARIVHPGIGLAEPAERARMGAGLAELCEIASRTELIDLIAIQVRTVPDDGAERAAWEAHHRRPGAPEAAHRVNALLAATLTPAAVRSEAFVTVVVSEARIARAARESGGGIDGRARVLYGAMAEIEHRLLGPIGATSVTWLDSPALATAIRTGFAPGDRAALVAAHLTAREHPATATGVPLAAAGPSSAHTEARHYHHDAWASITDTILLPEQGAVLGALAPVFVPSAPGERRAVTVFYPVTSQASADRLVGREEMSALTGDELRRRSGRLTRAKQRRATAKVGHMDDKLARGRALVRPCAAACITVPNQWPIAEHGRRLDAAIRAAGFIPQRLDLAQDAAFAAAAIPLGIGLPRRRGRR
jgi:hypothetical protein